MAGRLQRVAKAPRSRGNPFLPAYAGQKFLPPGGCGSLLLLRPSQRACKRQTAAPAPLRLFRPQDAPQLRSPWGQNLPSNRALGLTASHTLSVKFPCMCPVHPHMSAGQDFLIVYAGFWAAGRLCNKKFTLRRAKLCYNSCGTVMIVEKNNCAPAVGPCSERNFLCVMVKKLY